MTEERKKVAEHAARDPPSTPAPIPQESTLDAGTTPASSSPPSRLSFHNQTKHHHTVRTSYARASHGPLLPADPSVAALRQREPEH